MSSTEDPYALEPVHYNVGNWIAKNQQYFLPPVCNKMMHNTQLKVFYVGGPNQRKDYHLEEGEELFYMRKGDMCLKILEGGKFKDVVIKEGEVFMLPGKIPHSPQRQADTVGLVIERLRLHTETDGLRYFVEGTKDSLFERWFYCDDLGTQLGPVIKEFFASEQCRTGKPLASDMPTPAWEPDSKRRVEDPFSLNDWIRKNETQIRESGCVRLFDKSYQSDIEVFGKGCGHRLIHSPDVETFLWQLEGRSAVVVNGKTFKLLPDDTLLVPKGRSFEFDPDEDAVVMATRMDPVNRKRAGID